MSQSPSVFNAATRLLLPVTVALVTLLASGGCTRVHEAYPERSSDQVWSAMRAVAAEPRYDDWVVLENGVRSVEEEGRIEIYRELRRDLALPATRVRREDRSYRFTVTLADGPPPTVTFTSRGWAVPAHAHTEGTRYLEDVRELLAGMPGAAPTATEPARGPAPTPAAPPPPTPPADSPAAVPTAPAEPTRPPVDIELE